MIVPEDDVKGNDTNGNWVRLAGGLAIGNSASATEAERFILKR
jgi:hypothetical protein